jgi:hypothetical protein
MKKEFIPYQEAFELKQLGFNEPCFAFYQTECNEDSPIMVDDDKQYLISGFRTCRNSEMANHYISAPTYSQVFRWFREKHELDVNINSIYIVFTCSPNETPSKIYNVYTFSKHTQTTVGCFNTYEEAELACLKKLIEIVKGGNK